MTVPQGFVRRYRVPCPRSLARISAILPTGLHEASILLTRFRRLISPEILRSHIFLLNQAIFFAIIALLARLEKGADAGYEGLTRRRRECGCSWCCVRHCLGQFQHMLDELVNLSLCRMSIAYTLFGVLNGLLNITQGEQIVGQMLVVILNDGFQPFVDFFGG